VTRKLFSDDFVTLTFEKDASLVRYARSSRAYDSMDQVTRSHDAILDAILRLPRGACVLLLDVRAAPPRNDESFEGAIAVYGKKMFAHVRRHAVLVRTAAGRLQVARIERGHGRRQAPVFDHEATALRYLGLAVS
jgi:hypothetical protein